MTIQGAGHLTTSITSAIDDVSVTLAATAQRAVVDGIADVWDPSADAFPGFLSVLEAIAMTGVGPAEIVFGAGVYDFTRPPHDSPALLVGEPTNQVRRVRINGCSLVCAKRSGVAVQRSVRTVWVRDCYIEMAEPSTGSCSISNPPALVPPRIW